MADKTVETMGPREILDYVTGALKGVTEKYPRFYPYHPRADLAYMDDSADMRLSVMASMVVGKELRFWPGRSYYIPPDGVDLHQLCILAYDACASLESHIKTLQIDMTLSRIERGELPEPRIIGGEEAGA